MSVLKLGMRVRLEPPVWPDGITARWAGMTGVIVGFPHDGDVRVKPAPGRSVTCAPSDCIPLDAGKITPAADLQAIGDMLLARVRKVGVGRKATVLACLAALRSALDELSPDERAGALQEIAASLSSWTASPLSRAGLE